MSFELPERFPYGLSDAELVAAVEALSESVRMRGGDEADRWLPELKLALISSALSEQARRQSDASNRASKRTARISLGVAALALLVSSIGAATDYYGDQSWQSDQTRLLTEIRDRLSP